jgi:hypothetical protein
VWILALVVVCVLLVVPGVLAHRTQSQLRRDINNILDVIADMDKAYAAVQSANAWHEKREQYFTDLYQAARLLTEVFDERKYDDIEAMGINGPNGWVPSKQGLDAIRLHLSNSRDSVKAGRAAIRQLVEWERDNPPPVGTVE